LKNNRRRRAFDKELVGARTSSRAAAARPTEPSESRRARAGHLAPPNRLARSHAHARSEQPPTRTTVHGARAQKQRTTRPHTHADVWVENINNSTAPPIAADQTGLSRLSQSQYTAAVARRIPEERVSTARGNFKCSVIFFALSPVTFNATPCPRRLFIVHIFVFWMHYYL